MMVSLVENHYPQLNTVETELSDRFSSHCNFKARPFSGRVPHMKKGTPPVPNDQSANMAFKRYQASVVWLEPLFSSTSRMPKRDVLPPRVEHSNRYLPASAAIAGSRESLVWQYRFPDNWSSAWSFDDNRTEPMLPVFDTHDATE